MRVVEWFNSLFLSLASSLPFFSLLPQSSSPGYYSHTSVPKLYPIGRPQPVPKRESPFLWRRRKNQIILFKNFSDERNGIKQQ